MSLSQLKKNSSLEKLTKALQKTNTSFSNDEREWKPEVDKAGNGFAIIRFLDAPEVDGEDGMPWVQIFNHGFQGPGGWYIENSLTTLGQKDPVSEYNSKLWKTEIEANKEIARKQKRRLNYYSNILVVKDPAHPENEGKVFLYGYGKKIFDKIKYKIDPTEEEKGLAEKEGITLKPVNVFSFWEGHNFKLKIRQVKGYRNYDTSEFEETPTPVAQTDKEIEAIWKKAYSLKDLVAPDKFKSYAELETKLNKVLGLTGEAPVQAPAQAKKQEPVKQKAVDEDSTPPWDEAPAKAEVKKATPKKVEAPVDDDEQDAMLSMFKNLANAD